MSLIDRSIVLYNLPGDCTVSDITNFIESHIEPQVVDRTFPLDGSAFIVFHKVEAACEAKDLLDGCQLGVNKVKAEAVNVELEGSLAQCYYALPQPKIEVTELIRQLSSLSTEGRQLASEALAPKTELFGTTGYQAERPDVYTNLPDRPSTIKVDDSQLPQPAWSGPVPTAAFTTVSFGAPYVAPRLSPHTGLYTSAPLLASPTTVRLQSPVSGEGFTYPAAPPSVPQYSYVSPVNLPRLTTFSGDGAKGEASYQQWRHEVRSLLRPNLYPEHLITQAIGRSLKGQAAQIAIRLGEGASSTDIINKLDKIYGNVLPSEVGMEQFFSARQQENESVAEWSCRLEDLFSVGNKSLILPSAESNILKSRFFSGIRSEQIKNQIRHKTEAATYEQLIVDARAAEVWLKDSPTTHETKARVHQAVGPKKPMEEPHTSQLKAQTSQLGEKIDQIAKGMANLNMRLDALERSNRPCSLTNNDSRPDPRKLTFRGNCWRCGRYGHRANDCHLN